MIPGKNARQAQPGSSNNNNHNNQSQGWLGGLFGGGNKNNAGSVPHQQAGGKAGKGIKQPHENEAPLMGSDSLQNKNNTKSQGLKSTGTDMGPTNAPV